MSNIHILFADDEKEIRELVKENLLKEGYYVDIIPDGKKAIEQFEKKQYNLVILDIMMPEIDGIEVCRVIRNKSNIPIIMLSAKDEELDKVLGLRIGADDYVTKPFLMSELLARVKAQLRRFLELGGDGFSNSDSLITYGPLTIDLNGYRVYKNGEELSLTGLEFKILKLLISEPGKVFTKKQIFNKIWGDEYLEADNNVMVHIRRLRKKIEDDPQNPQYIETVWGIGYRFSGDE